LCASPFTFRLSLSVRLSDALPLIDRIFLFFVARLGSTPFTALSFMHSRSLLASMFLLRAPESPRVRQTNPSVGWRSWSLDLPFPRPGLAVFDSLGQSRLIHFSLAGLSSLYISLLPLPDVLSSAVLFRFLPSFVQFGSAASPSVAISDRHCDVADFYSPSYPYRFFVREMIAFFHTQRRTPLALSPPPFRFLWTLRQVGTMTSLSWFILLPWKPVSGSDGYPAPSL